jgi:hypothetical protein
LRAVFVAASCPALARKTAARTVAFHVRKSLAVKSPPVLSLM